MLSLSHTLTGAFIATVLPHPALYIPLSLAAHYFEDWIPHRDIGTGLSTGKRKIRDAILLELFELALSAFLLWFFWQRGQQTLQLHIWLAAGVSLLPDFLEAPRNFLKWEPSFLKPFNTFHNNFHTSTMHNWVGLLPQLILCLLILVMTTR